MAAVNVLIIGSGGREHALAWAIAASPVVGWIHCAPGNPGIAEIAEIAPLDVADHDAVAAFCLSRAIGLVVVGPEAPLVDGLTDHLEARKIKVFGPSRAAARLEGSKGFGKDLCRRYRIPTAGYERFAREDQALSYVERRPLPIVVKADGLAAGKGVTVAATRGEAVAAVREIMSGSFGAPECVIEEFLEGEEASFFAIVDGETAVPLATAQDYKRVGDGDTGPNTGGMGAYSPAPVMTDRMSRRAMDEIVTPTIRAMSGMGAPFRGVLYAGLMITSEGPKLIEYNVRFGDPECQVLMLRLKDDILTLMLAACEGGLDKVSVRWWDEAGLAVVMAARGYPGPIAKGSEIRGLDRARLIENVEIFQAATALRDGKLVANGGRVLNIAARGKTLAQARERAYRAVDLIDWPEGFCRRDIGWRALAGPSP
ncbi:MAG: phosphoribosylamine--glycine ligase [Hyphomicrobiales bacterium]